MLTYMRSRPAWIILMLYALGGMGIALMVPALKAFGAYYFGRSGYGVAIIVNIVFPVFFSVAATWYPKWSVALPGTFVAVVVFMLATGMLPFPYSGNAMNSLRRMEPIFVVACVAYHVISFITVPIAREIHCVSFPSAD